jgi:hypothetical protein
VADNVIADPGAGGATFATDDDGTAHHPYTKIEWGADNSQIKVADSDGSRLPVKIGNELPAGTQNIGDVDVLSVIPGTGATNLGKAADAVAGATDTGVAPLAIRDDALAAITPIEGDYAPLRVDANGALWVKPNGTVTVDGSGVTQPISAASLPLPSGAATSANQTTGNTSLATLAGAVSGTEMQVDVLTMPTVTVNAHNVTNAGTFVVQENGAALTSLQLLDDAAVVLGTATYTEATSVGLSIGAVRRDADTTLVGTTNEWGPLQMDANGRLKVEAFSGEALPVTDNGSSLTVDGTVAATQSGTWTLGANSGVDIGDVTINNAAGASAVNIQDGGNSITVDGTVSVTGVATETTLSSLLTSSQLIDDTIVTLGTDTYTEATSKGQVLGAVRRDADTTLVNTTNEYGPLQMDANGRLKVEVFSGETLPVSLSSTTITGTVAVTQSGTWDEVGINDSGNSITVDSTALSIGDGTNPVVVLTDGADNVSNANNQLVTASMLYAFDGTTFDRVTNGGGTEATALRVTLANDSTGLVSVDDNGASISVDWNGTQPVTGSGNATGALRVELANNGTGVLATVGAVTSITNAVTVAGGAANGSPVSGNPNLVAGRASNAIPTDVGADGDAASIWTNRNGAPVQTMAPHVGLNSDPWNLVHEAAQYTTTQTSTALVAGGASEKIVVTKVQIQAFATTTFDLQLYFGTGAFARGTNRACFDGTFKPSSTQAPGVILDGPFIAGTNGDDLMVTTSANGSVTINVWYYVIT